jgi:hypothetical protein
MKIPSSYLREKIASLIDGNVSYDDGEGFNDVVPVVSSDGVESKYQIFIGEYSDASGRNADINEASARQFVEIIEMDAPVKKFTHVDAIGEMVTDIIMPTTQSALLNGTDFHIIVNRPSVRHLSEETGDKKITNRLILGYDFLIHHN